MSDIARLSGLSPSEFCLMRIDHALSALQGRTISHEERKEIQAAANRVKIAAAVASLPENENRPPSAEGNGVKLRIEDGVMIQE